METMTINVGKDIHPELVPELEKQSVYISPNLHGFKISGDRSQIVVAYKDEERDQISRKVERFVSAMSRGFRPPEKKLIATNERIDRQPYVTNVFAKLVEKKWVLNLGQGQVGLSGPALAVANAVDRAVADIGRKQFGGVERAYPAIIPADVLVQCGYTSSMPQHLSIVTHMREDFEAIDQFRSANIGRRDMRIPDPKAFGVPKVCLCPALCYHCYPTLEGEHLGTVGHVETSVGRIARYESSSMVGLDRLWEFTQRSIIWLGEEKFCNDRRSWAVDAALGLAREWDIDCRIETANDPFFASVATAMTLWQYTHYLKFELRAGVEPDADGNPRTIAAASFNLHGQHFGEAFNIKEHAGGPAFSGCASWGVERWVLILFTQHGFDFKRWPAALRTAAGL